MNFSALSSSNNRFMDNLRIVLSRWNIPQKTEAGAGSENVWSWSKRDP